MKTSLTLIPGVENRRLGRALGDDGEARIVRSFHFRVRSVKCGGRGTARTRIAYVRREGKHAKSSGDVESAAGHKDALIDAADRVEATSRIKRGPTAERILQSFVLELPAESTPEERAATAEAVVEHWRTRYGADRPGHEAIAVVHMHGDESPQPHLHVEVAARPILADGTVDRSVRLWTDPSPSEAVKAERAAMAGIVNTWCTTEAAFHGGTFKEIGREDEGKPRLPISAWRAMRKAMRDAGDKDEAARIEAAAYAVEDRRREGLRETGTARAGEIAALKEAGAWPPRSRIAVAQERGNTWHEYFDQMCELHDAVKERAVEAEASAAGLGTELATAENEVATLRAYSAEQTEFLTDWHGKRGVDLPDLKDEDGRKAAWSNMRTWQEELEDERAKLGKQRDAANKLTEDWKTAWRNVIGAVYRHSGTEPPDLAALSGRNEAHRFVMAGAGRAEEREALQVEPIVLTEKQRPMLTDICARHRIEGDIDKNARVQLLAFAALHEELEERRREADAAEKKRKAEREKAKTGEGRHDERGAGEAGAVDGGGAEAGGGTADGDRRRHENGRGRAGERADRGAAGGDRGSPAAPAAPVAREVVGDSATPGVVGHRPSVVGGVADGGGNGARGSDDRDAGGRSLQLDHSGKVRARRRPDLGAGPSDLVAAAVPGTDAPPGGVKPKEHRGGR